MVYKKYIKKRGKLFGPYYYRNYRDEKGKVKTEYLGSSIKDVRKKFPNGIIENKANKNVLLYGLFTLLLLSGTFFYFNNNFIEINKVTDNLQLNIQSSFANTFSSLKSSITGFTTADNITEENISVSEFVSNESNLTNINLSENQPINNSNISYNAANISLDSNISNLSLVINNTEVNSTALSNKSILFRIPVIKPDLALTNSLNCILVTYEELSADISWVKNNIVYSSIHINISGVYNYNLNTQVNKYEKWECKIIIDNETKIASKIVAGNYFLIKDNKNNLSFVDDSGNMGIKGKLFTNHNLDINAGFEIKSNKTLAKLDKSGNLYLAGDLFVNENLNKKWLDSFIIKTNQSTVAVFDNSGDLHLKGGLIENAEF